MTVEELARAIEGLSQAERRRLVQQVPGLRGAAEREPLAETQAAYQVEETDGAKGVAGVETTVTGTRLMSEERRAMSRQDLATRYKNPVQWTEHPWVVRVEGYNSGRPIILGTRVAVRTIVIAWLHHGMSMAAILENWPVHEAQVYDALAYYYDHQTEVEADIEADSEERLKELFPH